jgi:hypothetical protein
VRQVGAYSQVHSDGSFRYATVADAANGLATYQSVASVALHPVSVERGEIHLRPAVLGELP